MKLILPVVVALLFAQPVVAQVSISSLPAASVLTGSEVLPIVQSGATKKATTSQFVLTTGAQAVAGVKTFTGDIHLGGDTASFPALKRASASLAARVADDSAYTTFLALNYGMDGKGFISAPADGVFTFTNNATTDFNRIQFGGATASFPALKRLGLLLQVRLADDSGDADLTAKSVVATVVVKTVPYTVATLPSAAGIGAGARSFVTDATASTFFSIVAGGGVFAIPVFSDGVNWRIG